MFDKFNFYDIFGYLFPGTLLLGLLVLPFSITFGVELSGGSITLLLVATYICGQLLQVVGSALFHSRVRDAANRLRDRSSVLLDNGDPRFSTEFKSTLKTKLSMAFQISNLDTDREREAAFFAARAYLVRFKAASYMERFESLYAMMRGMGCALYLGCAYLVGWALSFHWQMPGLGFCMWCLFVGSMSGALVASAVSQQIFARPAEGKRRWLQMKLYLTVEYSFGICTLLLATTVGYFLGTWKLTPRRAEAAFWAAAPLALIVGLRCMQAYRSFAQNFAETVWRDFAGLYGDKTAKKDDDDDPV